MEIRSYLKQEIALRQIETALEIFFSDADLFSAITLAAAAEELLAELKLARQPGIKRAFRSILEILKVKPNAEAQRELALEDEESIHMDPRYEAVFLLGRAIDDYQTLSGVLTPAMLRFNTQIRNAKTP